MKCLHILPMDKLSGAEKMVLLICSNLIKYEPIVICGGEHLSGIFKKNNVKTYPLSFASKEILCTLVNLKNIVKENDIKIIHAHDNKASVYAYVLKRLFGLNVNVVSHIHNCYPWLKGNSINKKIDSFVRSRYDYNIACGKLVYDYYRKNADYFQPEKTAILSNAIDIDKIAQIDKTMSEEIFKEYNIPADKIILGCIGRLSEQKGIIPFIKEFANSREKFTDCRVLLVGNGEQEKEVKALIKQLGLEELFILTGYQDDVYKFYPIIDIFFLPSLYEGLPMVLLEAMAFRKPIVAMDVGSISEIIDNGNNGYLVEKENYLSFINSLKELKNDEEMKRSFGEKSFITIHEKFDINMYVEKLENLYDELVSKREEKNEAKADGVYTNL